MAGPEAVAGSRDRVEGGPLTSAPQPVLTAAGVRALDAWLEGAGLLELAMEEAGRAVAQAAHARWPRGRLLLLAGGGANGGDALVAARHLLALGRETEVLAQPSRHPLTRRNRQRLRALGGGVGRLSRSTLAQALPRAEAVVDGLLGVGFRPPLRPALAEVVRAVNASGRPVLAVDLPSGLAPLGEGPLGEGPQEAGREAEEPVTIRADLTLALSGLKPELLFGPGAALAGELRLSLLGLPLALVLAHACAERPSDAEVAAWLPRRLADAHKGTAGHVWVVGGHPGTAGAPALAGAGALRAGAGLVTVYSEAEVPLVMPELMVRSEPDLGAALHRAHARSVPDALCVGMGLGPQAPTLAAQLLAWRLPTVLDADALQPELAGQGHPACVWTPHPGEAGRLLGVPTPEVTRDPLAAARALQERFEGVVVLKGGPTTVAHPGGLWVSRGGHPGMASAGMGDTLAGIIAALLGQGMPAPEAAFCGVTLHARAGERAARQHGYGLSASDVAGELGAAWQELSGPL